MKMIFKAAALALTPVSAIALTAVPAAAQSNGIGVVSLERAVGQSAAYTTATQQMQTTYKSTIDSLKTRQTAIEAEMKQKRDALEAAAKAAGDKPNPAVQTLYDAYQKRLGEVQQELQALAQPINLAQAYVQEQIVAKLDDALKAAMTKSKVQIVLKEAATESYVPSTDITNAVVAELNTLVPSVGIVPPQGWRPGQQGQAQAGPVPVVTGSPQKPTSR